jgi:heptosyltransferase-3
MAAALGTPTVALFGPSNLVKWGPWPLCYAEDLNPWKMRGSQRVNNVIVVQGEGTCVPCMEEGCECHNDSLSDCLQNLPVANVIAALLAIVARPRWLRPLHIARPLWSNHEKKHAGKRED